MGVGARGGKRQQKFPTVHWYFIDIMINVCMHTPGAEVSETYHVFPCKYVAVWCFLTAKYSGDDAMQLFIKRILPRDMQNPFL